MVNRGFSFGCDHCRAQHTRCDLQKPTCGRCRSRGIKCSGYRNHGGYMFRDQTVKVQQQQRNETANSSVSRVGRPRVRSKRPSSAIPIAICARNTDDCCLQFFFDSFLDANSTRSLDRGLYAEACSLYKRSALDSPLRLAIIVLSGEVTALAFHTKHSPWHMRVLSRAIEALRTAVSDAEQCASDATLMAILVLQKAEQIFSIRHGSPMTATHQAGALSILRLRGIGSVPDYLVAAVRSSVLLSVVYGAVPARDASEALIYLETADTYRPWNASTSMDQFLARAVCLWVRAQADLGTSTPALLEEELRDLQYSLASWPHGNGVSPAPLTIKVSYQEHNADCSTTSPDGLLALQQWQFTTLITRTISTVLCCVGGDDSAESLEKMLATTSSFFHMLPGGRKDPAGMGRSAMAAMFLHLIVRCLFWFCEQAERRGDGAAMCLASSTWSRVQSTHRDLSQFLESPQVDA